MRLVVLGVLGLTACGEKIVSGDGYDLSEVEDAGEALGGDDANDDEADTGDDEGGDEGGDDTGGDDEPPEPSVDQRTYGMKMVISTLMPGVFDPDSFEEVRTTSYQLIDWTRTGTNISWRETLCSISATEAHGAQTSFPSAFVTTTPVRERTATLSVAEVGARFETEPYLSIDGADLSNPWTDSLPYSTADVRLVDRDSDGHPGVTIHVDAGIVEGDVYVVQRSEYQLSGVVVSQERVEAYVDYGVDQSVLDASNPFLTMAEVNPVPNPDSTASYLIFQQVDDDATCSDIRSSIF
jgi:hypothetical protein